MDAGGQRVYLEDAVVVEDAASPKPKARKKPPVIGGGAGKRSEPQTRRVPVTRVDIGGNPVSAKVLEEDM